MSIFPKFFFTLFKGGLVRPIWERVSALYLDFLNDNYIVSGTPSTFDSYVTHSRNGNATMVDSDGLIKWAPHNLVTYSEDFSNAAWINPSGVQPYLVSGVGPNGEDAFKVESGSGFADLNQYNVGVAGNTLTGTVYIKAVDGIAGTFSMFFSAADSVSFLTIPADWQEVSATKLTTSPTSFSIRNATKDFYILRANVHRSDLGGMVDNPDRGDSYVPTTSSAVYLPRRNHYAYNGGQWVNEGLLTESESRQNLVQESEDFSGYTLTNLASIAVSATPLAPDGNQTALRLLDNSSTSLKALSKSTYTVSVVSGDRVTISAYFQKGTLSYGVIYAVTGSGTPFGASPGSLPVDRAACFDLDNGNVGIVGSLLSDGRVENVGNGWYRCSVTVIAGGTGTFYPAFGLTDADDGDTTYTSVGTGTVYLWGAQMEVGATPSSYMPTSGATFTRAADTLTIPAANLPWPTPNVIGSELVTNGTFDTDTSGWSAERGLSAVWSSGAVNLSQAGYAGSFVQAISLTAGKVYKVSADVSNVVGTMQLQTTSNSDGSGFESLNDPISSDTAHSNIFTATANDLYLAITLNAGESCTVDNVSVKEIDPLSVSIQMDGRVTYADEDSVSAVVFTSWLQNASNFIDQRLATNSTRTGGLYVLQAANSVLDTVIEGAPGSYNPGVFVPFNIASRHGSTFLNGAVEGTALTANTTPTSLPDLSSTDLNLAYDYMGTIRTFRMWDADLTDEGIAYVSERSEEPTISLSFNRSESSFTVSDWLP